MLTLKEARVCSTIPTAAAPTPKAPRRSRLGAVSRARCGARAIVMLKNERERFAAAGRLRALAVSVRWPMRRARCADRGGAPRAPSGHVTRARGPARGARPRGRCCTRPGVDIDGEDVGGVARGAGALRPSAMRSCLCLGEAATMSGEAASRAHPDLPGQQRQFAEARFRARARVAQAGDRRPVLRPPADRAVADRARRCGARGMVSRAARRAMRSPTC